MSTELQTKIIETIDNYLWSVEQGQTVWDARELPDLITEVVTESLASA